MKELDMVNEFLSREDLSGTNLKVKEKCLSLNELYNRANQELQTKAAETERLRQHLEAMLAFALELAQDELVKKDKE